MTVKFITEIALLNIWKKTVEEFADNVNPPSAFISKEDLAILLLVHYNWNEDKIKEELMKSAENVYAEIGLSLDETTVKECCVCGDVAAHLACGHTCDKDLKSYLTSEIESGKAKLRCANHTMCHVKHLRSVLQEDDMKRFDENLGRSFVHGKPNYTLCLCNRIIFELEPDEKETNIITCVYCNLTYCFKCKILHLPATCDDNETWTARPFGDGIKPCPKCKVRTVKEEGCLHMTCKASGCSHEYCWSCLKDWSDKHGFYVCNSKENLGGDDSNLVQCENELRKVSELRKEHMDLILTPNKEENEIRKSRFFSEPELVRNHSQMGYLLDIIKWSNIHFCYNPDSRAKLADDLARVSASLRENLDGFTSLANSPVTYLKEQVAARSIFAKKLITELISKHHTARNMTHETLSPIPVRAMWQKSAADLSLEIVTPSNFITTEDFALMVLIEYNWDTNRIKELLKNSPAEVYQRIGVCQVPSSESKCDGCIKDLELELEEAMVEARVNHRPGRTPSGHTFREAARKLLNSGLNPACGFLCEQHVEEYVGGEVNRGLIILKCPDCFISYPKSCIGELHLERFMCNIDVAYHKTIEGCFCCPHCSTYFRLENPSGQLHTYACGSCFKIFSRC